MNEIEQWVGVPSTEFKIEVSSLGRVRRTERELVYKDGRRGTLPAGILRGSIGANGYHNVSFGSKALAVHRLIAEAFLAPPSEILSYQTVNHKNGLKTDNRPENLEWSTYSKNNEHARSTKLNLQSGENTNLSKYGNQLVAAMINVSKEYSPTHKKLADMFGMSRVTVGDILRGKSRKMG